MRWLMVVAAVEAMIMLAGCSGPSETTVEVRIERLNPSTKTFDVVIGDTAPAGLFAVSDTARTPGAATELVCGNGTRVPSQPRSFQMLPGEATFKVTLPNGRVVVRTILIVAGSTAHADIVSA